MNFGEETLTVVSVEVPFSRLYKHDYDAFKINEQKSETIRFGLDHRIIV